jgi:succinate dehydrogenase/fumarate reductase flavoprotein subunit
LRLFTTPDAAAAPSFAIVTGSLSRMSPSTAIATGGAGRIYVTTNAVICEHGGGLAGPGIATLGNMEAVQFHRHFPAGILVTKAVVAMAGC